MARRSDSEGTRAPHLEPWVDSCRSGRWPFGMALCAHLGIVWACDWYQFTSSCWHCGRIWWGSQPSARLEVAGKGVGMKVQEEWRLERGHLCADNSCTRKRARWVWSPRCEREQMASLQVCACDTGRPEGMGWNSKSNFNSSSILSLAGVHTLEKNAWLGCKGARGKWLFGEGGSGDHNDNLFAINTPQRIWEPGSNWMPREQKKSESNLVSNKGESLSTFQAMDYERAVSLMLPVTYPMQCLALRQCSILFVESMKILQFKMMRHIHR